MRVGIVGSGNIVVTCLNAISQIAEITCEAIVVRESVTVHQPRLD